MMKLRVPLRNLFGAKSAWISVGAPIIALVLIVMALSFTLVAGFARQQDEAFVENSQLLVENAMRERVRALKNIAIDYAVWNEAYAATTDGWDSRWLASNYYSNVADGVFIVAAHDGALRYSWVAEALRPQSSSIANAVEQAVRSTDLAALAQRSIDAHVAVASLVVINGHPAIVSMAQIAPEGRPRDTPAPHNFLAAVDVLSDAEFAVISHSLSLQNLAFATGHVDQSRLVAFEVANADAAPIGALTWRRETPGSDAFLGRIWPIGACLIFIGALTLIVARHSVLAYVRVRVRSDAIQESSRLKAEFIATMSHELRTPLNTIVGYTELIQEQTPTLGEGGKTIAEDADRVLEGARHLGRLVNNILDQSRIDAGRLRLSSEPVKVGEILAELEELMAPLARANHNAFEVGAESDVDAVKADPVRLQQCLVNLTNNALKFTQAGRVRVIARRADDRIVFDIHDTGVGIDPAELERLFQPFPTPHAGGVTGISLSITRSLVRAMGGDVTAQSVPGQGSTFTLALPAATVHSTASA